VIPRRRSRRNCCSSRRRTFTIRLIGDYSHGGGNCCYATSDFKNGPTQPLVDLLTTLNGGKVPSRKLSDYQQTLNGNGRQTITDYGGTLQIEAGLGGGTLKSVTAIRKFKLDQRDMDPDFSARISSATTKTSTAASFRRS
jgi:hypothetical protein